MSNFEFFLSLYGLLLGFSLVEVLGGLARTVETRLRPDTEFRVGLLTPLLGIFVLFDLLSFWSAAWVVRDQLQINWTTLIAALGFTGSYYLAAYLVFPREPEKIADLDTHYFRINRIVLGTLLVLLALQLGYYLSIPALAPRLTAPVPLTLTGVLVALMIAAIVARGPRLSAVLLGLLCLRYLVTIFFQLHWAFQQGWPARLQLPISHPMQPRAALTSTTTTPVYRGVAARI